MRLGKMVDLRGPAKHSHIHPGGCFLSDGFYGAQPWTHPIMRTILSGPVPCCSAGTLVYENNRNGVHATHQSTRSGFRKDFVGPGEQSRDTDPSLRMYCDRRQWESL